jgi:hypothetical protein
VQGEAGLLGNAIADSGDSRVNGVGMDLVHDLTSGMPNEVGNIE